MKRLIAPSIIVLMLSILLAVGVTTGFTLRQSSGEETTQDIGAVWDQDVVVRPATFKPTLSSDQAIIKAAEAVKKNDHWDVLALKLPAHVTIGKFTGEPEGARPFVTDLPVRIVVFENIPIKASLGQTVKTRISVVLDDATGEFVYGVISGQTRKIETP